MADGIFSTTIPTGGGITLGEGIVYVNHGEVGQAVLGATRGGCELKVNKEVKEIEYDGAYGKTKGLRRVTMYDVDLVVNLLKISYTNPVHGMSITSSDGSDVDGTYKKLTFSLEITDSDVLDNVSFVGQKLTGETLIIKVLNALNINGFKLTFKSKDEVSAELTYSGFYAAATPLEPPLEIWDYLV